MMAPEVPPKPIVRYRNGSSRQVDDLGWLLRCPVKELDHFEVFLTGVKPSEPGREAVLVAVFKPESKVESYTVGWASLNTLGWWFGRRKKFAGMRLVVSGEEMMVSAKLEKQFHDRLCPCRS